MQRPLYFALAVSLTGAGFALAQVSIEPPSNSPPPSPQTAPAEAAPAAATAPATLPSAESVLQNLLQRKQEQSAAREVPTTRPEESATGMLTDNGLLLEGQVLTDRAGHLIKNEKTGELEFDFEDPKLPTMGVIPSRRLWAMEEARYGGNPRFHINAQVTQYRGRNYLYIQYDEAARDAGSAPTPAPSPATAPAVAQIEPVAPNAPAATRLRERQSIYNRTGRLVKDEKTGQLLFVFDSDGKQMYDPPMAIVPCRYLAVMEDASDHGNKPMKFRISAEVTQYRGKNFLYPKFVQTVRELGQGIGG